MTSNFKCAMCGGTFDKGWSDEERLAEMQDNFPGVNEDQCETVCDECYKPMVRDMTTHAIYIQAPPGLKAIIDDAAAKAKMSVNSWAVMAMEVHSWGIPPWPRPLPIDPSPAELRHQSVRWALWLSALNYALGLVINDTCTPDSDIIKASIHSALSDIKGDVAGALERRADDLEGI